MLENRQWGRGGSLAKNRDYTNNRQSGSFYEISCSDLAQQAGAWPPKNEVSIGSLSAPPPGSARLLPLRC